tara:strand:+ start:42 stop:269 length:228 start_codon:yes stop_codon:yes gene_type:complete
MDGTIGSSQMKVLRESEISLVDQYLNASCFNKISDRTYQNMLSYESKADPIEKKLITRIKEQIKHGKVVLSSGSK